MKVARITDVTLVQDESMVRFVIRLLLEGGLRLNLTVDDETYEGYVHNLDFGKGNDWVVALVMIPGLNDGEDVKVSIRMDGTVRVLPDELQEP
ncbi:MAG: hypothetical protein A2921_04015 [Candidatus Magasanikbacteria bacterium RIFCSPLOWO2_01_FULL_43_20b]|uniref:Uncharacterized protein n=1 Tax=Candidatus Magasanikbacteria bacterium RIFCSPLOWO2_12_FULL_43_12 TaxID=1798692 RepID=A0A1F6MRN6_9BACT|nr:MAG: hypothetical protein A3C74_03865 [Candidatus Magasanikbacteria bacterium RIFCSPHIGHO2_02_FULL_44_13]OGH71818.1 MAG: hypothetical protein A3I93_00145 [Candidatus Magasanikbacteria bacterium RIFCSPLOWO2_02_FULL_43_22]OGH73155.1 MAG: hypothetical protein A2921_04015 [Candidatus Magasanikbacteria bacterium RIFCSPLOWO2_01_FULL_43_20b]OGH74190.1 MAG: hypothetical protein A3G00_02960 [Candidatus Magasanikbacteria bacterium RIFCSPLOWO2_12_FULL_43_12]